MKVNDASSDIVTENTRIDKSTYFQSFIVRIIENRVKQFSLTISCGTFIFVLKFSIMLFELTHLHIYSEQIRLW